VILTCHSYVTVYIYPRYSHLKSLASYFRLQVSRTHPHVCYSFLLRTSAIQSLTQTGYGPLPLDCAPTAVFIVLSSSTGISTPYSAHHLGTHIPLTLHAYITIGLLGLLLLSLSHFTSIGTSAIFDFLQFISTPFSPNPSHTLSTCVPAHRLSLISPLLHQPIHTSHVFLNSAF